MFQKYTHSRRFTAWKKVYHAGNDPALIALTGLDFQLFELLNQRFELVFDGHSPFILDENGMISA